MMTPEQVQKFQAWVNTKNATQPCEACSKVNWATGEIVLSPTYTPGGGIAIGGGIPMLQLICTHCSNVRSFAAVPILGQI